MIKALLLDLDGTLLDEERAWTAGTRAFYEAHRERLEAESFESFERRSRLIMNRHWARCVAGELDYVGQQRERAREALGLPLSDTEADEAFAPHRTTYQQAAYCYDDVAAFLARTKSFKKIVVTNANRAQQRAKMGRAGLLEAIPGLVTPEDAGGWKPDAKIFNHALRALGIKAEEAMMIGDDYECDIAPAKQLGMQTFWVRRPKSGLGSVDF